jgi:MFS family permease
MNAICANCDAALATGPASARETRHSNWLLTTTILASSLAFLDGSVVNIGLPSVGATFKASPGDLQWVINAYLLPLSALLLLGGAAGDRFGRVRFLIMGTAMFGGASIVCALAPSLAWLRSGVVGRESARHCSCRTVWQFLAPPSRAKPEVGRSASGHPWVR